MTMPAEVSVEINGDGVRTDPRISWRAVLAGVVVALAVQLILSILGAAIGLAMVDPTMTDNPASGTVAVIGMIWWTLSGVLAAWAGGVTAGRLSGLPGTDTAAWHGFVAWAATILVVFYLLGTALGGVIGGAFGLLRTGVEATAWVAREAVPAVASAVDPFAGIEPQVRDAVGARDPASARDAVVGFVRSAFTGDQANAQAALDRAADALARASGLSPDEARARLMEWQDEFNRTAEAAKAQAAEAADTARAAASAAGIVSVIALVFGAIAGWFGGLNSARTEPEGPFARFGRPLPR